jgi:alpha-tubulin suppressor-like RCC1 family protein
MPFTSCGGCLKNIFITEAEIIDRYVGNQLWSWGNGNSGQLGINVAAAIRSSPVQTVSGGTNWKSLALASDSIHMAAIKTDGSLWLWGEASSFQLGNSAGTTDRSSPVQTISGGTNWKQVAIACWHSSAIKTDGTLWLWGDGSFGKLGTNNTTNYSSPVQTVSGGTNWKQVSVGSNHYSAAIKTDGTLWLWGTPTAGVLGDNAVVYRSSPVQTISAGTNWKSISTGYSIVSAIKTDGSLWVWGEGSAGRLGTNDAISRSSPVQTVSGGTNWKQVSAGDETMAAIKTDGTLWVWGGNGATGRLGTNNTTNYSSPVQTVSGGTNWKQVNTTRSHTAAIKTDGTLWSWGDGTSGILGNNTAIARSSPVQVISAGTNWKSISATRCMTAAITFTEL